jgi:aminoglycoside 6'-N-acetyltransferase I
MIIRRLEPRDRVEWLRMRDALWPGLPPSQHQQEMARFSRESSLAVFVHVRENGRLGGFLEAGTRPYADGCESSPVGYIEGWYVDPDVRQQGVGRALIQAAENWAKEQGYSEMASDCLLENSISFQAHQHLGYREVDRLIHFHKSLKGDLPKRS